MSHARREGIYDTDTPMMESRISALGFFRQQDPALHLATGKKKSRVVKTYLKSLSSLESAYSNISRSLVHG